MNYDDLKEIIHLLTEKDIEELAIERGSETVRIKRSPNGRAMSLPLVALAPATAAEHTASLHAPGLDVATEDSRTAGDNELHYLKSPTVGIFRESRSRGAQPLTEPGTVVEPGQVVCCIEVLRLLNDVASDASGEVVKKCVTEGQPVEYGQPLFAIRAQS